MNQYSNYLRLILIFFPFLFLSCSNEEENEPIQNHLLLKTIYKNGVKTNEYIYNNDGTVNIALNYSNGIVSSKLEYIHLPDTLKINKKNSSNVIIEKYKYFKLDANNIKYEQYSASNQIQYSTIYQLLDTNCGHDVIYRYNSSNSLTNTSYVTYVDANCSYTVVSYNSQNILTTKLEVLKDDKMNIYLSLRIKFFNMDNDHNLLYSKVYNSSNQLEESYSYNSTYTYNSDNYPITQTRTYYNGNIENLTFEYY